MEHQESNKTQNDVPEEPTPVPSNQLSINLKIISPSLVQPLTLRDVPAATTVRQLKERIRQELPTRPADNQQRLIYRGRMINRPDEELLNLFGEDMVSSVPSISHVSKADRVALVDPLLCPAIHASDHPGQDR